ncbi:N-(5'-phosphoribosyl)anthranilate isomerase [bacterium BMS3Bbin14]|nr:N-(5'-phosphoribosyl)anthranilate isomerase [bacterium BMS3Abin13]GBE53647.1 N-(5'-phosphoribosyl)anthranilate isomerase [bacterium BMS3Bbin14]
MTATIDMSRARIRIKMCGITRMADAAAAVAAGVDALGFIFFEKSPRYISPEAARLIIEQLPPFVDAVGVFVDKKNDEVDEIIQYCRLGYVQLHGAESPKYCEHLVRFASPCQVIKAFRVGGHTSGDEFAVYAPHVKGFLLDTFRPDQVGGTGTSFDWSIVADLNLQKPFILAGGLDVNNIAAAIQAVRPYGVDVSSGVERQPGIKDHRLIREFVSAVRDFDSPGR